jgi:hypothetical protein
MGKFLHWTAILAIAVIPLIPKIAFSQSTLASTQLSVLSNSATDSLLCYFQTSNGKVVDLTALCTPQSANITPTSLVSEPTMVVSDLNYDGHLLTASVTNKTGQPTKSITVNYEILDSQGNEIDAGFVQAVTDSPIPLQGVATIREIINQPGATVKITSVDWEY